MNFFVVHISMFGDRGLKIMAKKPYEQPFYSTEYFKTRTPMKRLLNVYYFN